MIDLWLVASNSLWIAGLSLLLATLSWASWAASVQAEGIRGLGAALAKRGARLAWGLGLALFCAGMAATGRAWWERAGWGTLAIACLVWTLVHRSSSDATNVLE